jgi:hypothetical protein
MKHRSGSSNASRRHSFLIACSVLLLISLLGWSAPSTRADSKASAYLPATMRHLTNYTEVPTSNAVATATATPTPSATATTTATATPTATPTVTAMPSSTAIATVTATATATMIPTRNCNGVYPIWVKAQLLGLDGFLQPSKASELPFYVSYSDETYTNKIQRRLYLSNAGESIFGFLRWRSDIASGNVMALTNALTGTGTLEEGFDEVVPWPDSNSATPPGYPLAPHRLNAGDWLYEATNVSISADMQAALDYHIAHKTVMILPIVNSRVGAGTNVFSHMNRFGNFLLRGSGGGGSPYLDLVYVGEPSPPPCE